MTKEWRPAWELEAEARAVNAQPWEPLPGMVKRQCSWCRYFFAAPIDSHEPRCPAFVVVPPNCDRSPGITISHAHR